MADAIIVGGGISGLTAAYLLTQQGKQVKLIAPEPLGGMLMTKHHAGFTLEQGPNVLLEKPEFGQLLDQLNLRSEMVYPVTDSYRQFVWHAGQAVQVPKSLMRFIGTKLFSFREKLRILRAIFIPGMFQPSAAEETVAVFFERALGAGVVRRTLDPVLKGIYGGSVDKLSAKALFPTLWESMSRGHSLLQYLKQRKRERRTKPRTFLFRRGMITLANRLREMSGDALQVLPGIAESFGIEGSDFRVTLDNGESITAPQLVLAISAREAAKIISRSEIASQSDTFLQRAALRRYAPLTLIHCETDQMPNFPGDTFGILFPEGTPNLFLGAMFNSLLFPHLAPKGKQLLTLCFGGVNALENPASLSPDDSTVIDLCNKYLGISKCSRLATYCWQGAIPQYEIGHQALLESIVDLEQGCPGLTLALIERGGVGVPDRVRSVMELLRK